MKKENSIWSIWWQRRRLVAKYWMEYEVVRMWTD